MWNRGTQNRQDLQNSGIGMLEGLNRVDWASLGHAYGSAADVPRLLRELLSPRSGTRDRALWSLYGNIFHQGTRYEASAPAVPFLLELVESPATPDRHLILELIVDLALGYPESYLPFGVDFERDFPDDAARRSEHAAWARAAYEAVEAGVEQIIPWTADADAPMRRMAVFALAWFPRRASLSAPAVRDIARRDDTPPADRANALLSLGLLDRALEPGDERDGDAALFTGLLGDGTPPLPRLGAAVALASSRDRDGADLPDEALGVLLAALRDGAESGPDDALLWNDGDLAGLAGMVLSAAAAAPNGRDGAQQQRERVADALCAALPGAPPMNSLTLTGALLALVRPMGNAPWGTTPLQRQALRTIADHGAWNIVAKNSRAVFGNYGNSVGDFGLPGHEEAFRRFVDTLPE